MDLARSATYAGFQGLPLKEKWNFVLLLLIGVCMILSEVVELFFEEVRSSLEVNEQVKLSGFGNFDLRDKSQRPGRNPKTGEEIPITARRVVTFRPGQKLKARVEAYAGPRS